MKPTICICCGEHISASGNALSRNPNLCASCSSLADGMAGLESTQALLSPDEPANQQARHDKEKVEQPHEALTTNDEQ